jgi:hypothetical protein
MLVNNKNVFKNKSVSKSTGSITIDLQYLSVQQAKCLIEMFDTPEDYAENFSTIKAITRGLNRIIIDTKPGLKSPIGRMFHTVNEIQGVLMREDMKDHHRILDSSGLMPDPWIGFKAEKGGESC